MLFFRRFPQLPFDQLHIDLWFKGYNVLLDAGTYLYNAKAPWTNALASTIVHNTVCVNGRDQMLKAGRFLWLDWAQARILESSDNHVLAEHDGYRKLGITHQRELQKKSDNEWLINDQIISNANNKQDYDIFIHWLLPDWEYTLNGNLLKLKAPFGQMQIRMATGIYFWW